MGNTLVLNYQLLRSARWRWVRGCPGHQTFLFWKFLIQEILMQVQTWIKNLMQVSCMGFWCEFLVRLTWALVDLYSSGTVMANTDWSLI